MNILDRIIEHKRQEVLLLRTSGIKEPATAPAPLRGFSSALVATSDVAIIAEVKKASPSKGLICPDFHPVDIAKDYEAGGASAISVLTDEVFFQGSLKFLPLIKDATGLPVLRKDFIIDHLQVKEARIWGADAILLIVACLEYSLMHELYSHAKELSMDVLVETHDEAEMELAIKMGADLIGVNNRNLKTFEVSLDTTFRLQKLAHSLAPIVSESGISTHDDMKRLRDNGIAAALIGEGIVKHKNRVEALKGMVEAGSSFR